MSLQEIMTPQTQHTQSTSKRRYQQTQNLMNIISGVNLNTGATGIPSSNHSTVHGNQIQGNIQKSLAKTKSAFLETQEHLKNMHMQNVDVERELAAFNSKRKVTRLKDKKGSRNNTQSLLEHLSFKSKNSHQGTTSNHTNQH